MTPSTLRDRSVRASVRLYQVLIVLFPPAFRRDFGRPMLHVFRTACGHAAERGARELLRFWLHAFADVFVAARAERLAEQGSKSEIHGPYVYLPALALSLVAGYFHLHSDADAFSVVLLLCGGCVLGAIRPTGAWKCAAILGLGIPFALLVGHGGAVPSISHRDTDLPWPAPLLPALFGAYAGVFMHRLFPRITMAFKVG